MSLAILREVATSVTTFCIAIHLASKVGWHRKRFRKKQVVYRAKLKTMPKQARTFVRRLGLNRRKKSSKRESLVKNRMGPHRRAIGCRS